MIRSDTAKTFLNMELTGIYGDKVLADLGELIKLYEVYDGSGQIWSVNDKLDYEPTMLITNHVKKLIKREARFMFGRTPEITVKGNKESEELCTQLQTELDKILRDSVFPDRLIKAARDCFIGKRVAIKLSGEFGTPISVSFRPAMEFVYVTADDNVDELKKIIFFYAVNNETDKINQRYWKQKYEMVQGRCFLNEGIYNGFGDLVEGGDTRNTGLSFIPCRVIINDGLTGDMMGESDVAEIAENQAAYNRLKSDDIDALRFNMFPQRVAIDASEESLKNMCIAPGALVDLQTDPAAENGNANLTMLESGFNYDSRFENSLNRIKNDMFDLLGVPNVTLEQLQGAAQSGKSMKALYWEFIERCEEKWATWEPVLKWAAEKVLEMANIYGNAPKMTEDIKIHIEHLYPILEDDENERRLDMQEVTSEVRSHKSYIEKWGIAEDADAEIQQIAAEKSMLMDTFDSALNAELNNANNSTVFNNGTNEPPAESGDVDADE